MYGDGIYYQIAEYMVKDDIPYPQCNLLFWIINISYYIVVVGGSTFVVFYTIVKIKWYEREIQKYAADSYSKILPMRGQMTMFLFLIAASIAMLPFIHFLNKENYLSFFPIYNFLLSILLVNTCRKIHHGYKHIEVEGQEMVEIDKERAFYEDVFNKYVANSQEFKKEEKEEIVEIKEEQKEDNSAAENSDKQSDIQQNTKQPETTAEAKTVNNLLGYVSALDISNSLNELMFSKKLYLQQDITIKEVASAIGTNSSYLSIYMNRMLGLSFSEYINKLRIEREVLPLLKTNPDTPTKELILAGNFAHRTSFYRAFQKVTGEAFMDYRDKLLRGHK